MSMNNKGGLSSVEAKKRLIQNGPNVLKEERQKTVFEMFVGELLNFTNFILLAAIIISLVLKDFGEAAIIFIIIIANAIIGVVQENKAQKALNALKKMSVLKATVIRDGEKKEISSEELVVGDIVLLEAGQNVPADLELIETINLKIDEKTLTGESVPVEKDANFTPPSDKVGIGDMLNRAYMSTSVTYGRGVGKVCKTGMDTEIGKIADMVQSEKDKPSPLQVAMDNLSKVLGIVCVLICVAMFILGMFQKRELLDMLMSSVSLAVAAIPEGIPTIVTVVLALGVQKIAKVNALVKKLPAIETLGCVSYVCSDKTGTLTQNKMTVVKAFADGKYLDINNLNKHKYDTLLNGFLLCCDASITKENKEIGDPTEVALVRFALENGLQKSEQEDIMPRINELAFDSDRKLMTTMHRMYSDERSCIISYTKGSTDAILPRCTKILDNDKIRDITEADIELINNAMSEMSLEALRVLSLAYRYYKYTDNVPVPVEEELIYVGMVGMIDPEREEVKASIETFKHAGIKTIMITGDHKDTAFAIAKKLGIAENINECIMGYELDELSDEELRERAKTLSVFARVSPEHKVRIVKAFQDNGFVVSMSGDGTNDAPSLRAADVGVAMGITGTDVAKDAADIILQDDSFTTIEKAIQEGRKIYNNIKKSILFAISSNISEILTMFITIAMGLIAPFKAVQILWINLLTDSLPCLALGVDTDDSASVMSEKPRKKGESVFARGGGKIILLYSVIITIITLSAYIFLPLRYLFANNLEINLVNLKNAFLIDDIAVRSGTYAFCVLAISQLFHAVGMRDTKTSIFKKNLGENKLMILALIVGFAGQIAVTEIPFLVSMFGTVSLSMTEWILFTLISTLVMIVHEVVVMLRKNRNA